MLKSFAGIFPRCAEFNLVHRISWYIYYTNGSNIFIVVFGPLSCLYESIIIEIGWYMVGASEHVSQCRMSIKHREFVHISL